MSTHPLLPQLRNQHPHGGLAYLVGLHPGQLAGVLVDAEGGQGQYGKAGRAHPTVAAGRPDRASYARARVEIQERLDGSLAVTYQGRVIASKGAPPQPAVLRARKNSRGRGAEGPVPSIPGENLWW